MSDMARKARLALKAKAKSLANEKDVKTDSSDWKQAEPLNADVKTGARPVSRRAFKKGGKVEGEKAKANMGKKQRAMGGSTPRSFANAKINRNVKDANEERSGKKHIGAFKKGGRTRREEGGEVYDREGLKRLIERESTGPSRSGNPEQVMPKGKGVRTREIEAFDLYDPQQLKRLEAGRKKGGRAKKQGGGAMMMDPRLGMVKPTAFEFTNGSMVPGLKKGGKVHSDEAMDKALIKKMVKPSARKGRANGGGMRSEYTGLAKADREARDRQQDRFDADAREGKNFDVNNPEGLNKDQFLYRRNKDVRAKEDAANEKQSRTRIESGYVGDYGGMRADYRDKEGNLRAQERLNQAPVGFGKDDGRKRGGRTKRASGGRQGFASAFAEARKNGMDLFEWNGKLYNTKLADSPKSVPTPPRRPGFDIGAGERPEQSGRELANEPPPRRMTTINETDAMGSPTGMTREVEQPQGRSLRETLGDAIGIRGRNTPMFSRGSGSQIYAGPRDESESGRKKGGRAKRACGGYAGGGMAEQGGKRGKKGSGKTNINIVIASGKPADQQQMQQMPPAPPPGMMPPPPPGGAPMPPPDMGGMAPPPMGRKRGGRAAYAAGGKPVSVGTTTTANRPRVNTIAPAPGLTTTTTTPRPAVGTTTTTQRPPVGTTTTTTPRPGLGTTTTMPQMPTPVRGPLMTPPIGAPAPRPPVQQPIRDPGLGAPEYDRGPRQPFPGMQPPQTVMPGTPGMGPQFPIRDPGFGTPGYDLGPRQIIPGMQLPEVVQPGFGNAQNVPMTQAAAQAAANAYMQNLGMYGAAPRKSGGRVTKVAKSYQDMEAGAGSGEGRLQKTDIAKKQPKPGFSKGENVYEGKGYPNKVPGATGGRTARADGGKAYRTYKDMDAGAGSGEGRLEKTEIQKRKR